MCLGHGIRVGWGKNEPESKGKSIYIPTEIWDHAGAFLHIITTVNCSLEVDEREVKKEAGFSAKLEGEKKKVTSTHKKRIYGCLKRFRLSINIFFITKREAFYSVNESRWGRTNCGEHKIDEVNLAVNAISRDSCYFWTLWTTRSFVANSIYLMRCLDDKVSS